MHICITVQAILLTLYLISLCALATETPLVRLDLLEIPKLLSNEYSNM